MNPYQTLVTKYANLLKQGKKIPLGGFPPKPHPALPAHAPKALIFSPHPDDECIIGALPLRLRREARMEVINVAVTLGSKKSRRPARLKELKQACAHLGFGLMLTAPDGLEHITPDARKKSPTKWAKAVKVVAEILSRTKPRVIFLPHEKDGHQTHIGTHYLVLDALASLPRSFKCVVVETEFWALMDTPNLMVESSVRDVTALLTALSCHAGEVRRNPYHLLLPAWLQDNVRRGAELVGGHATKAPDYSFATLYRVSRWSRGRLKHWPGAGKMLSLKNNPANFL